MEDLSSCIQRPAQFQFAGATRTIQKLMRFIDSFIDEREQLQIAITLGEAGDIDGARAAMRGEAVRY